MKDKGRCFVALIHPNNRLPIPVMDNEDDDVPAIFESHDDAKGAMKNHYAAQTWGYWIIPWPPNAATASRGPQGDDDE